MAIAGKKAAVFVMNDDAPIQFTEESTSTTDDLVFEIDDRDLRYWSREDPVIVEEDIAGNWTTVATERYRVQHAGGRVHFRSPNTNDVRVSGYYVTVSLAAQTNEYTMSINGEMLDTTVFINYETEPELLGWRRRKQGIKDVTGTVGGFWDINNFFTDRILNQKPLILELTVDQTVEPEPEIFAMYAFLESQELASAVDATVDTSVSYQSDGDLLIEGGN